MAHENLGATEHRQDVTRRLAAEGFATLTVDLFSRIGGQPPQDYETQEERRVKAFLAAADEQACPDLLAGVEYLRSVSGVDADHVGTIGFCMGGGTSLVCACTSDAFRAAVILYALPILPARYSPDGAERSRIDVAPSLRCPLQGHFGEADDVIPLEQVQALEEALRRSGQHVEIYTYADAGHAFHDDTHPRHHAAAAETAWERSVRFLRERL
jgi:carboxymethylenebutenolidase